MDLWPGQRFQDAAISEIAFVGSPAENRAGWSTWTMQGRESYRGEARCLRESYLRRLSENPSTNLTIINADISLDGTHGNTSDEE